MMHRRLYKCPNLKVFLAKASTAMTPNHIGTTSTSGTMDLSDPHPDISTLDWHAVSISGILWSLFVLRINYPYVGLGYVPVPLLVLGRFRECVSLPRGLRITPAISFARCRIILHFLLRSTTRHILASSGTRWPSTPPRCSGTLKFSAPNYRNAV